MSATIPITDSHCHLTSRQLAGEAEALVARAVEAGVSRLVTIGCDLEDSPRCADFAAAHKAVFAAVGVHPCSVTDVTEGDWLEQIRALAARPKVVAIGEIGLDYYHPAPDGWTEDAYRERQKAFFAAQLELAADLGLNVVVHQRDRKPDGRCWPDIVEMVAPFAGKLRAVFHCFTHPWVAAAPLVEQGHVISFTGIVTYPSAGVMQDCARDAAPGSFMVETDAPYLAPVPHRGKRCEPAFTRHTAECIAGLRGVPLEQIAADTETTAEGFFGFGP